MTPLSTSADELSLVWTPGQTGNLPADGLDAARWLSSGSSPADFGRVGAPPGALQSARAFRAPSAPQKGH